MGLAGAIGLGRLAESLLFQLKGWDPVVLGASAVMLTIVALGAGFIPAHRASQVEPMRALRCSSPDPRSRRHRSGSAAQ